MRAVGEGMGTAFQLAVEGRVIAEMNEYGGSGATRGGATCEVAASPGATEEGPGLRVRERGTGEEAAGGHPHRSDEGSAGQSTADDLVQDGEVGGDAGEGPHISVGEAEAGEDLLEHREDVVLRTELAQGVQVLAVDAVRGSQPGCPRAGGDIGGLTG